MMESFRAFGKRKARLTIKLRFISSAKNNEKRMFHIKSFSLEIIK